MTDTKSPVTYRKVSNWSTANKIEERTYRSSCQRNLQSSTESSAETNNGLRTRERNSLSNNTYNINTLVTLSPPIPLRLYTLPYWSNPTVLIFDIRTLWRSRLSARAPECRKSKLVGKTSMALDALNSSNLEQLALKGLILHINGFFTPPTRQFSLVSTQFQSVLSRLDPVSKSLNPVSTSFVLSRLGLHRISYPAPAEIRPRPDMAAGYEVGFDHLSTHLPHCVIGQEFIVLQIR